MQVREARDTMRVRAATRRVGRAAVAAAMAAGLLWAPAAFGQTRPPGCDPAKMPDKVAGQVVKVDTAQSTITIRSDDGATHQFQANRETVKDVKVGDRIEAALRSRPSNC